LIVYNSQADSPEAKMMGSLTSIIKKGGVFVSVKQQEFLTKVLRRDYSYFDISVAGLTPVPGMHYVTLTSMVTWSEFGGRSRRQ
jgi:hypothetical protein